MERSAGILGAPGVSRETRFRELPGWCSMLGFGLLVMIENECGVAMDVDEFMSVETLGALYDCVCRRIGLQYR